MSGSANRIMFLSFVRERESIRGMKRRIIVKISMEEKGVVRNVK